MKFKTNMFDRINMILLAVIAVIAIFPVWQMVVITFSSGKAYLTSQYHLIPTSFSLETFNALLQSKTLWNGLRTSLIITSLGWAYSMLLTTMGAYALSKKDIIGRKIIFNLIVFTMFFNGGMIPLYITVKKLQMTDTIFALIIPYALSTFNLLLVKSYFQQLPVELEEAARIDGYNDIQILFTIMIPISKPVIATVSLFYLVQIWNDFFSPMLFLSTSALYPLALILRNTVISKERILDSVAKMNAGLQFSQQYYMAMILVALIPIVVVYPFIQKYFVSGIMLGAIKG